jgi:hypothetical protein
MQACSIPAFHITYILPYQPHGEESSEISGVWKVQNKTFPNF